MSVYLSKCATIFGAPSSSSSSVLNEAEGFLNGNISLFLLLSSCLWLVSTELVCHRLLKVNARDLLSNIRVFFPLHLSGIRFNVASFAQYRNRSVG